VEHVVGLPLKNNHGRVPMLKDQMTLVHFQCAEP
jgi:hypothetical protein